MSKNKVGKAFPSLQPPANSTANSRAFSATPSCPNKLAKTTLLLILLTAVCVNAEWKFDNDTDVQEREDKRSEEREEARKALERVRFGVKAGGLVGLNPGAETHDDEMLFGLDGGIMINIPLSRLANGNLVLATELNCGFREQPTETYLNIPLMFQYVSFFFPTSDIQVHWVKSPKRHVFMHFKTIAEAGVFIDIPLNPQIYSYDEYGDRRKKDYKDRNFFDPGIMVGGAVQLESFILGIRGAASYTDLGGVSSLLPQLKAYLGYLF